MKEARILYGSTMMGGGHPSEDILWKTRFAVPDPVFFVEVNGSTFLFTNELEYGRAKEEAKVDEVINTATFRSERRMTSKEKAAVTRKFLEEHGVRRVVLPSDFPAKSAEFLRKRFMVRFQDPPFYQDRIIKTDEEIGYLKHAQETVESSLQKAIDFLRICSVKNDKICHEGREVTAEQVKEIINLHLYKNGYLAGETIVASGTQAAKPHDMGSGVLLAYSPIIIDIFPVHMETHYWGDMTRTVFKGEPAEEFKKMYDTVLKAQTTGIKMVRAGVAGADIHNWILEFFEESGYPRDPKNGRGFIHSTGHGLGLEIHEYPRIGTPGIILEERYAITIEPGLYYPKANGHILAGGIRIEDVVIVEKDGCRNLNVFPKDLESMIL
ncbi:MAG: Xaa-Pro peptidase family protein [bacterium]|nr:Xaa-Pro peptidase family protein [bacterium]